MGIGDVVIGWVGVGARFNRWCVLDYPVGGEVASLLVWFLLVCTGFGCFRRSFSFFFLPFKI